MSTPLNALRADPQPREAAIEAAARHIYEEKGDLAGILYVGWDAEPDAVKEEWRRDVRSTIDAYEGALEAA